MPRNKKRLLTAALVAAALPLAPSAAEARLFWQTYGATVAAPDGAGCVWNQNQDYFVPRHCDSGRYDLFSPCKTSHAISAACRNLHPVYDGYCGAYGPCHYRRRDHVYKVHCLCTPLRKYHGPWRLETCKHHKHALVMRTAVGGCCGGELCRAGYGSAPLAMPGAGFDGAMRACGSAGGGDWGYLANVESLEGETLGCLPLSLVGASRAGGGPTAAGGAMSMPVAPMPAGVLPALGITTPPATSGGSAWPLGF